MIRYPLPSPGFLGWVPLVHRYYGVLRLPAAPPAAFRFLHLAVPRLHCIFVSPGGLQRETAGQGFAVPVAPYRLLVDVETTGSPRFLGNPHVRALLLDPDGTKNVRPLRRLGAAFRFLDGVGSRH